MAKKEEFKHDIFRENLVKGIDFIKKHQQQFIQGAIAVLVVIAAISWYITHSKQVALSATKEFGIAQNLYIDGQREVAMIDLKNVIRDFDGEKQADFARLILIEEALKNNELDSARVLIDQLDPSLEDDVIQAAVWGMKGDLAFHDGDYSTAIKYYQKAADTINLPTLADSYRLGILRTYMAQNEYDHAAELAEEILENKELRFAVKNEVEELLAEAKFRL